MFPEGMRRGPNLDEILLRTEWGMIGLVWAGSIEVNCWWCTTWVYFFVCYYRNVFWVKSTYRIKWNVMTMSTKKWVGRKSIFVCRWQCLVIWESWLYDTSFEVELGDASVTHFHLSSHNTMCIPQHFYDFSSKYKGTVAHYCFSSRFLFIALKVRN